jgi:hypothetical protein
VKESLQQDFPRRKNPKRNEKAKSPITPHPFSYGRLQKINVMDKVQLLLVINSILLSFLSIMFLVIGYFLKDLHKDFKQMVERVNTLYTDHNTHVSLSQNFDNSIDNKVNYLHRQVKRLTQRCEKLENEKP